MNPEILSNNDLEKICLRELRLFIKENRQLDDFSEFLVERFLLHFIRGRKCDSKKAYATLENYFHVRRIKYRKVFKSLRPSTNTALDIECIRILKNRDSLNRLIVIHRDIFWDPRKVPIQERSNMLILAAEEIWNFKDAEVNGIVIVMDLAGYNLSHAMAVTVSEFMKNNFPLRAKAVHFVNENYVFTLLFRTLKPFLPNKIKERLHFHSSKISSFHQYISPDILPDFLGGKLSENEACDMKFDKRIREKEDYYQRLSESL